MIERQLVTHINFPESGELSSPLLSNQPAPSVDDWFTRELVRIGGRDKFGDPVFRVVWGQSELTIQNGESRMKYKAQIRETASGLYDVGLPRFIIEEKYDALWVLPGWKEAIQGPKPLRGQYRYLIAIQDEFGNYEPPGQSFINALERARFYRDQDELRHSHEETSSDREREQEISRWKDAAKAAEDKKRATVRDMIHQHYKERIHRITHLHPNEGHGIDKYRNSQKALAS